MTKKEIKIQIALGLYNKYDVSVYFRKTDAYGRIFYGKTPVGLPNVECIVIAKDINSALKRVRSRKLFMYSKIIINRVNGKPGASFSYAD